MAGQLKNLETVEARYTQALSEFLESFVQTPTNWARELYTKGMLQVDEALIQSNGCGHIQGFIYANNNRVPVQGRIADELVPDEVFEHRDYFPDDVQVAIKKTYESDKPRDAVRRSVAYGK